MTTWARARLHFIRVMYDNGWSSQKETFDKIIKLVEDLKKEIESGR